MQQKTRLTVSNGYLMKEMKLPYKEQVTSLIKILTIFQSERKLLAKS